MLYIGYPWGVCEAIHRVQRHFCADPCLPVHDATSVWTRSEWLSGNKKIRTCNLRQPCCTFRRLHIPVASHEQDCSKRRCHHAAFRLDRESGGIRLSPRTSSVQTTTLSISALIETLQRNIYTWRSIGLAHCVPSYQKTPSGRIAIASKSSLSRWCQPA